MVRDLGRVVSACLAILIASDCLAEVDVTIEQSGADVVATASGSLDTASLSGSGASVISLLEYVGPGDYAYLVGMGGGGSATVFLPTFATTQPLQGAAISVLADSSSGGPVGVDAVGGSVRLYVPAGYVSGSPVNASSTWAGQTLASLGLAPGSYAFDFGADSITFTVVGAPPGPPARSQAIPVMPAGILALLVVFLGIVGAAGLRRSGRG